MTLTTYLFYGLTGFLVGAALHATYLYLTKEKREEKQRKRDRDANERRMLEEMKDYARQQELKRREYLDGYSGAWGLYKVGELPIDEIASRTAASIGYNIPEYDAGLAKAVEDIREYQKWEARQ